MWAILLRNVYALGTRLHSTRIPCNPKSLRLEAGCSLTSGRRRRRLDLVARSSGRMRGCVVLEPSSLRRDPTRFAFDVRASADACLRGLLDEGLCESGFRHVAADCDAVGPGRTRQALKQTVGRAGRSRTRDDRPVGSVPAFD